MNESFNTFSNMQHKQSKFNEIASYQKEAENNLVLKIEFETIFADFESLKDKFSLFP